MNRRRPAWLLVLAGLVVASLAVGCGGPTGSTPTTPSAPAPASLGADEPSTEPDPEPTDSTPPVEIPSDVATRMDVPRPEGPRPASCDPLDSSKVDGQDLPTRVAALRSIGFFRSFPGSDADVAARLAKLFDADWGPFAPDDPLADLLLARYDEARVWWNDLEADVAPGNDVYVRTIGEWAAITGGAFAPADVAETWQGERGPVVVTFESAGQRHELHPEYLEDWIDPRIATPINELIESSGRQLEFYRAFDQTAFIATLTIDEKRRLETERGWCFEWPSS